MRFCLLLSLLSAAVTPVLAQAPDTAQPARNWALEVVRTQIPIITRDNLYLRYRSRRVNNHGDLVRDTIEAKEGAVARLIRKENRALTPEEDAAERARLEDVLNSPSSFARHHKRDSANLKLTVELVSVMPDAMNYTYVSGQPQLPGYPTTQVVIDFRPNPAFHAANMPQQALSSLEGRIWIDSQTHHMVHMEGHIFRDANLGWGLIAKVFAGGKLELDQKDFGNGLWAYQRLTMDLVIREVMVHTVQVHSLFEVADVHPLPGAISWQEGIKLLLATPLPH